MRVAAVTSDLMIYSRVESAATAAGASLIRLDSPTDLPKEVELVLVDWSAREPRWAGALITSRDSSNARLIMFGQHTDLEAHAAARAVGVGPMWARSRLLTHLNDLMHG